MLGNPAALQALKEQHSLVQNQFNGGAFGERTIPGAGIFQSKGDELDTAARKSTNPEKSGIPDAMDRWLASVSPGNGSLSIRGELTQS